MYKLVPSLTCKPLFHYALCAATKFDLRDLGSRSAIAEPQQENAFFFLVTLPR